CILYPALGTRCDKFKCHFIRHCYVTNVDHLATWSHGYRSIDCKLSVFKNAVLGIGIIIVGCIGLLFFQADTTIPRMMMNTAVLGAGFGVTSTLFTVVVQSAVDWNLRGAAMGSMSLMRNLGQTIGIAVSGIWLSDQLHGEQLARSLHLVFSLLVGIAIVAFILSLTLKGKKLQQSKQKSTQ